MSVTGMNIVVTGASSGVGEVLALRLASQGNQVIALARRNDALQQLADRASEQAGQIIPMTVDQSDANQVQQTFDTIHAEQGPIDVLINNAAVFTKGPLIEKDLSEIDRIVDTNLKGLLYCTRLATPPMIERGSGRIINIASVAGIHGIPGESIYCASKHGVVGFGDALAQELVGHGIQVTTLCPGGINTPLWNPQTNPYGGDVEQTMAPEEIADLVDHVLTQPKGTIYKRVVFFPAQEWH